MGQRALLDLTDRGIDISKEPEEEGSQERLVHITGPPECVAYVACLMRGTELKSRGPEDGE